MMKHIKCFFLMLIVFLFAIGCAGNYGKFKKKTGSESKATKQQLVENWSDFDIWIRYHTEYEPPRISIIIFDSKNDDKEIFVGSSYSKVKDQEMWTEIVKANTASEGEFILVWDNIRLENSTGVLEIWGSEKQLYGFIIHQEDTVSLQRVEQVDENSIRLSWGSAGYYDW